MPSSTPDLHNPSAATHFYDDRFAQGYMGERPAEKRLRVEALIRELNLPSTGCALDFGCGAGVFTEILGRALPGWSVEGTDLSATAVSQAAARLSVDVVLPALRARDDRGPLRFRVHAPRAGARQRQPQYRRAARPDGQAPGDDVPHPAVRGRRQPGTPGVRDAGGRHRPRRGSSGSSSRRKATSPTRHRAARLLWTEAGFRKQRAWYANHWMATVAWLSSGNREEVGRFADPAAAVDGAARRRLLSMRLAFTALLALRKPVTIVGHKRRFGCHGLRDYILLGTALLCWPIAYPVDRFVRFLTEREWQRRKDEPGGAEMCVAISRSTT